MTDPWSVEVNVPAPPVHAISLQVWCGTRAERLAVFTSVAAGAAELDTTVGTVIVNVEVTVLVTVHSTFVEPPGRGVIVSEAVTPELKVAPPL
jgi:hypothetical protein